MCFYTVLMCNVKVLAPKNDAFHHIVITNRVKIVIIDGTKLNLQFNLHNDFLCVCFSRTVGSSSPYF